MNTGGHIPGKRECIFLPLIRVCPALLQEDVDVVVDEEGKTSAPVEKSRKREDAAAAAAAAAAVTSVQTSAAFVFAFDAMPSLVK